MNIELVRNHAVLCLQYMFYNNFGYNEYKNIESLLREHSYNEILSKACGERYSYLLLTAKYNQALEQIRSNAEFIFTYKLCDNYNVCIQNEIFIYYFQDNLLIGNENVFPWRYPHCISCVGRRNGYCDDEIVNDFLNLSLIDFYIKYSMNTIADNICKKKKEGTSRNFYLKDNAIRIVIDEHITIYGNHDNGIYIADTWWSDDDEIIYDLSNLHMIDFGKKYKAFWCP